MSSLRQYMVLGGSCTRQTALLHRPRRAVQAVIHSARVTAVPYGLHPHAMRDVATLSAPLRAPRITILRLFLTIMHQSSISYTFDLEAPADDGVGLQACASEFGSWGQDWFCDGGAGWGGPASILGRCTTFGSDCATGRWPMAGMGPGRGPTGRGPVQPQPGRGPP